MKIIKEKGMSKYILSAICYGLYAVLITVFMPDKAKAISESPETVSLTVRAYCPKKCCCGRWADGITASGEPAVGKFVASSKYPFGTKVHVPGYGEVEVLDRGPNIVEVFFSEHSDALEWGKQELKVRVCLEAGMG